MTIRGLVFAAWFLFDCFIASPLKAEPIRSQLRSHKAAYKPTPERGEHIDIKVTPPAARGRQGRVLVEIYNRGKVHVALVQCDVTLKNRGGFSITAPVKAEDLRPNMSGSQWIKIPLRRGSFPDIDQAVVENLRIVTADATEIKMNGFVDLIKN
jgi:hypothetical protein